MGRRWMDTVPSPPVRVLRTVIQVILAALVAIPTAVAALDLPADITAKVGGIASAAVIMISAIQNAIEAKTGHTALVNPPAEPKL